MAGLRRTPVRPPPICQGDGWSIGRCACCNSRSWCLARRSPTAATGKTTQCVLPRWLLQPSAPRTRIDHETAADRPFVRPAHTRRRHRFRNCLRAGTIRQLPRAQLPRLALLASPRTLQGCHRGLSPRLGPAPLPTIATSRTTPSRPATYRPPGRRLPSPRSRTDHP